MGTKKKKYTSNKEINMQVNAAMAEARGLRHQFQRGKNRVITEFTATKEEAIILYSYLYAFKIGYKMRGINRLLIGVSNLLTINYGVTPEEMQLLRMECEMGFEAGKKLGTTNPELAETLQKEVEKVHKKAKRKQAQRRTLN